MSPIHSFYSAQGLLFFVGLIIFSITPDQQGLMARSVSGNVFEDYNANANAIKDAGEPGISNITVNGFVDGDAPGCQLVDEMVTAPATCSNCPSIPCGTTTVIKN